MTIRIILFFSLSMIFAPTSFALVGTMEEAIAAGITGEEPEYIADAMFELNGNIHRFVLDKNMNDPEQKFILWHAMRVVLCAIYAAARDDAIDVVGEGARVISEDTALGAARNVLLWSASFDDDDPGFKESLFAATKIVRQMTFDFSRAWAQEALEDQDPANYSAIASRVTQWVALNILLTEFDTIVSSVYENALDTLYPYHNPFREARSFAYLYRKGFGNVDLEVMHILAPWLIHMVPLNLVGGVHERLLFKSFLGTTNGPRRRPMPVPVDVPMVLPAAVQIIDDILPFDIMDFADLPDHRLR